MQLFEGPDKEHTINEGKEETGEEKPQRRSGFEPSTTVSWGMCSATALQPLSQHYGSLKETFS